LFHILYDGTVLDEKRFSVLGGDAEAIAGRLTPDLSSTPDLALAIKVANRALSGPERNLVADDLEVAVLRRNGARRAFVRLDDAEVERLLAN